MDFIPLVAPQFKKPRQRRVKTVKAIFKDPLMFLNEIKPNLVYETQQFGSVHDAIFTTTVTMNGSTFSASARSKKLSRQRVAEVILRTLVALQDPAVLGEAHLVKWSEPRDFQTSQGNATCEMDFSSDTAEFGDGNFTFSANSLPPSVTNTPEPCEKTSTAERQNPVAVLNSIFPAAVYELTGEQGQPHNKTFTVRVTLGESSFTGSGSSKKLARSAAAKIALRDHFGHSDVYGTPSEGQREVNYRNGDFIYNLVSSTFRRLTENLPESEFRYKIMAGIVQTRGCSLSDSASVICVTTGTKCISGGSMSLGGMAINDCHAEILARRCLVDYLYHQLQLFWRSPGESIFEHASHNSKEENRLQVKSEIRFHLYVSGAPCGDARIFSCETDGQTGDAHANRKSRGVLRTKIESGEGTIPATSSLQTWDAVALGDRLRTMSCSDKMASWNVLGLQGSLLSHLIKPVYLDSVTVASLFNQAHMERALFQRFQDKIHSLPPPFQLSVPQLCSVTTAPPRVPSKSPGNSFAWAVHWQTHEIINGSTGRLTNGEPSRLCKQKFLRSFLETPKSLELMVAVQNKVKDGKIAYADCKHTAGDYFETKAKLFKAFESAGLGSWMKKPMEQNFFVVSYPAN